MPAARRHPLLYEINTRCWLADLSERAGRRLALGEVPESEFEFWQRFGFTHIWLMGVWTLGRHGRAHSVRTFAGREEEFHCSEIAGSPFAISGYTVSPNLGGEAALAEFRRMLNARGIKLVLDFIPNHTAIDHPWVKMHPEFYVTSDRPRTGVVKPFQGAKQWFAHGHCGFGEPWVDTLQLDHRNPELRRAMIDELLSVSTRCDGVRCDMAMLMLNDVFANTWREFPTPYPPLETEFWRQVIEIARGRGDDFLFLAEAYWDLETQLQHLGFDYTYDKRLYDRIVAREARGVGEYLQSQTPDFLCHSAHFIENHDERRIASLLSFEEHCAAALLVLALPGMRFLHEGQMTGAKVHANVHFARRGAEAVNERIAEFYARLSCALGQTSVGRGKWKLLAAEPASPRNATNRHFVLVQWQSEAAQFDLAVINLASTRSQCFAPLSVEGLEETDWRLVDLIGDEVHQRSGVELSQRGLYLDLAAHGAQLFHGERMQ